MTKRTDFDSVIDPSRISDRGLNSRDKLRFHYFNPNGLCAMKRHNDDRISRAHDAGLCYSGAIMAYGICDSFSYDAMSALIRKGWVSRVQVAVALDMLADRVVAQHVFLSDVEDGSYMARRAA